MATVDAADLPPHFLPVGVEEDECGRVFEIIDRCQVAPDATLDVNVNDVQTIPHVLFESIYNWFGNGAVDTIRRLEFQQDGCALPDHGLNFLRSGQERRLAGMQNQPGRDQTGGDHAERQRVTPGWVAGK